VQPHFLDLETEHVDVSGNLWYVRYPFEDGSGFITVATTRPETILGDTAVAVYPKTNVIKMLFGKKGYLTLCQSTYPIIAEEAVETNLELGLLKLHRS